MTGLSVRLRLPGATRRVQRATVAGEPEPAREAAQPVSSPESASPPKVAQRLALAHQIERHIESGEIADYADAARALGLTRARLTQVMNLLLLAPAIQEALLTGRVETTERALRAVVGEPCWERQEELLG